MLSPKLYIKLFNRKVQSFHFFGVLGYTLGTTLGVFMAVQLQLQPFIVLLMAGIGAAIFFLLAVVAKWITGGETIVYYHHEIAIMIFCALTLFLLHKPVLPYLDITLTGIGVFLAFGRIGCYSVGCCHGCPSRHGVRYGQEHVDAGFTWFYKNVPLTPVQLIESAYVFFIVVVNVTILSNHVAAGTALIVYTVIYGVMRFILEYFRGDPERPSWMGVSEAQWTTVILIATTYGLSKMGFLPEYNWHLALFIGICICCLASIVYRHYIPQQKLFTTSHIQQLAEGLTALENANALLGSASNINIYTTGAGLCISTSKWSNGDGAKHYTVSLKNGNQLKLRSAHYIARLIGSLTNRPSGYKLIERENCICHIVFDETKTAFSGKNEIE